MVCNLLENHVFLDALCSRLLISYCISGSTMEKTMISSGSSVSDVMTLYKKDFQSSQRAVSRSSGSGNTSSDDYDIKFVLFHSGHFADIMFFIYVCPYRVSFRNPETHSNVAQFCVIYTLSKDYAFVSKCKYSNLFSFRKQKSLKCKAIFTIKNNLVNLEFQKNE